MCAQLHYLYYKYSPARTRPSLIILQLSAMGLGLSLNDTGPVLRRVWIYLQRGDRASLLALNFPVLIIHTKHPE